MNRPAVTVAVQGEPGSNSALAAEEYFGKAEILPCRSFADLFQAVRQGAAPYGMAPAENSLGGAVHPVWDLLARASLPIHGEHYFHVRHCLIAHPGTALQEIRWVYSHEQALAQCRKYLQKLVWIDAENIVPAYDTAGAVKMVKARGRREEAAIAPPQAAALYGMRVLAEDIQTDPRNHTRFLVLSHRAVPPPDSPCKTTLLLDLPDCACSLPDLLGRLSDRRIELLKLETRKRVGHPWVYTLYLECAGRADRDPLREVLAELGARTDRIRLIGSYPRAPLPDS